MATADASMALNRATKATNQGATSMGLGTTANNLGMLAIGVNNDASIGDPNQQYYYTDGAVNGLPIGVAFMMEMETSILRRILQELIHLMLLW